MERRSVVKNILALIVSWLTIPQSLFANNFFIESISEESNFDIGDIVIFPSGRGCIITEKLTKKFIGEDVDNKTIRAEITKVAADKMKYTPTICIKNVFPDEWQSKLISQSRESIKKIKRVAGYGATDNNGRPVSEGDVYLSKDNTPYLVVWYNVFALMTLMTVEEMNYHQKSNLRYFKREEIDTRALRSSQFKNLTYKGNKFKNPKKVQHFLEA